MMKSVRLEDASCPLCSPMNDEIVLAGRDLIRESPGEFTVVKCRTCGLMRTNPRPTPETNSFYYPDDYGPYIGTQVKQNHAKPIVRSYFNRMMRKIIEFNTDRLPVLASGRMLEVGCASGSFLHKMAGHGWQVQGIEFSEKAAQAAAELSYSVYAGSLETAPKPSKPFNLIVGWMVLEHVHDPIGGLKKLRQWANSETWLVLSLPNAASLEFRFFKGSWYNLHLPNHLYHFTPETLSRVLKAGGWTLEKVYHQRVLSSLIASTGYVLRDKGYHGLGKIFIDFPERSGRWPYILYPLAYLLSLFGQTGRMTVWARVKA